MSVQVRRRREAAAFLAGYVGAQGELLVDTTNNRVQVHDGATAGGFPAAGLRDMRGFNIGINTNCGINQRGVSGAVTLAAGAYGHDRHKAGANGCSYTFSTATNGDTVVTITTGSLLQPIDVSNVWTTALWLTWTGSAAARVYQGAASGAPAFAMGVALPIDSTNVNAIVVAGLALGTATFVEFSTGTLNTTRPWQLEAALPNAGPTGLGRRHGELGLCQRYFQRWTQPPLRGGFFASNGAFARAGMPLPVTMRATPTAVMNGNLPVFNCASATTAAAISTSYCTPQSAEFDFSLASTSGFAAGQFLVVYQGGSSSLDLSAEL